jgi:hypothetical protein
MVLDSANGVAKGEGGCLHLQHVRPSAVEEHDREALVQYIPVKMGGGGHTVILRSKLHHSFVYTLYIIATCSIAL